MYPKWNVFSQIPVLHDMHLGRHTNDIIKYVNKTRHDTPTPNTCGLIQHVTALSSYFSKAKAIKDKVKVMAKTISPEANKMSAMSESKKEGWPSPTERASVSAISLRHLFVLPWVRPYKNRGKCHMDRKRIQY